ncbi:MAG: DUF1810 domain-containing protein [Bacteroidaceae bacterium]|nr:DUF1810 domain-containing protein [Bacteroidaceae bacterium]
MQQEETDITRFLKAQDSSWNGYSVALSEIKVGRKTGHWIWYIFPQLRGLGYSHMSQYYGIADRHEAEAYLQHPVLGARLREITEALLEHTDKSAHAVLGGVDALKVQSCMTLFDCISPDDIFERVLTQFYEDYRDKKSIL